MDRLHPILLFSRSIFDASAHAAGKGGGADVAALEGEQLVQCLVMRDRRKFCVIDEPRQYENLRLSQE